MVRVEQICQTLSAIAPLRLAESWDNVGLLLGDRSTTCDRLLTCLTITPEVVAEAIDRKANMIVAHHPLPFKPLAKITSDTITGKMLLDMAAARIAVYSAHTAFDSAADGINQQLAAGLGLSNIQPIDPASDDEASIGSGRYGSADGWTLKDLAAKTAAFLNLPSVRYIGNIDAPATRIAFACGSGGSFLDAARRRGCDALVTGESNFHGCLEAKATEVGLILVGHYASERFAMEQLARSLASEFPAIEVWASTAECDPIQQLSFTD